MRVFLGCFWATDPAWKRGNGTLFEESKLLYLRDYELLIYFFFPSCFLTGTGRWSITPSFRNQMMLVNDFFLNSIIFFG